MIRLHQFSTSPFTEKVARALNFKKLEFEVVEVDRLRVSSGDYDDVSPTGKFPAIKDGVESIWDSTDIIFHLEKKYPEHPLVPHDKRDAGLAHAIEEWADESLYFYEMTMRLSWDHNLEAGLDEFSAGMPGVPREQLRTMILESVGQLAHAQGIGRKPRDQIVADVKRHFDALDSLLEATGWVVGEQISYADLAVVSQVNALLYAREAQEMFAETTHVQNWMDRIDAVAPKSAKGE